MSPQRSCPFAADAGADGSPIMRSVNWLVATGLAGVMVAGTALAGGGAEAGGAKPPELNGGLGDPADSVRKIDRKRGPFYGLRVNSMDLAAEATRIACFEYACDGLLPGEGAQKYQVVRSAWRGEITPNTACDEVLGAALAPGANVRYPAHMITTRWIRDVGPNGRTPVGGFVGELAISVARGEGADAVKLPLIALRVIGTQGLRPGRGDPDDLLTSNMERCSAPRHDEGSYHGGFDRRGLAFLANAAQEAGGDVEHFRTLANSRIVGTFEGQLSIDDTADARPDRFCNLTKGQWWFDGLLGWRCKRAAVVE